MFTLLMLLTGVVQAEGNFNLGVVLNGTGWNGDNGPGRSDFNSDKGGQFGLSLSYSQDRFYTGLSLQGGEYQFENSGPDQFTSAGNLATSNIKVEHSDFDLLAGYYVWEKVSVFVDLKSVISKWLNNNYEQSFSGLGFGVSGYKPLDDKWILYASWGFVGGKIKETDNQELGDAVSNSLSFGGSYTLTANDRINVGIKVRNYVFDYDNGAEQEYSLNGLFFGYNHVFEL